MQSGSECRPRRDRVAAMAGRRRIGVPRQLPATAFDGVDGPDQLADRLRDGMVWCSAQHGPSGSGPAGARRAPSGHAGVTTTLCGVFDRVRRGWDLTKMSWGVIRSHPGMAHLPLTGGALALLAFVVLGLPGAALLASDDAGAQIGGALLVAVGPTSAPSPSSTTTSPWRLRPTLPWRDGSPTSARPRPSPAAG